MQMGSSNLKTTMDGAEGRQKRGGKKIKSKYRQKGSVPHDYLEIEYE